MMIYDDKWCYDIRIGVWYGDEWLVIPMSSKKLGWHKKRELAKYQLLVDGLKIKTKGWNKRMVNT